MRIKLLISYDGTDFAGWQLQDSAVEKKPTIQGTLEDAIGKVIKHPVRLHGSGRTDAGAHAIGQVAHFDSPIDLGHYDLRRALAKHLPPSIVVRGVWEAPADFHSLFQASGKTYKYLILNRQIPSAIHRQFQYWVRRPLDLEHLQECSRLILGQHDFKSFQTRGTPVESTIRQIYSADWRRRSPHVLEFSITGNGFLKQMVRNLVGTMMDLNLRKEAPSLMTSILESQDRRAARAAAPSHGLYLYRVFYPQGLDNKCRKL
jgi:tRNA pseudouridine38-40 synthase